MDNIVDVEERSHMLPESNLFSHTNTFSDELNLEDLTDKQLLILDLRYFLMNPIQKWKAKNKFPLKFTLQLFKLLLLSIQIIIFSSFNKNYVEIEKNIVKYLKLHIFDIEQNHIIYSYSSLNQQIDHISNKFKNVNSTQSINSFSGSNFICYDLRILNNIEITEVLIKLDLNKNDIIKFNNVLKERNINITKIISVYIHMEVFFNIHSHLDQHNTIIVHHRNIIVHFEKRSGFYFNTEFLFDIAFNELKSDFMFPPMYLFIFDTVVTLCVLISLILTVRSVCRSNILRKRTVEFMKINMNINLTKSDQTVFLNGWFVGYITFDIISIVAIISIMFCRVYFLDPIFAMLLIGISCIFVWISLLRYLIYFKKYNIIMVTAKVAFPQICRFLMSAALIFLGYAISGRAVFGAYHENFETMFSSCCVLFSIMLGDLIFDTMYSKLSLESSIVRISLVIFVISFCCIFIFLILNTFTSIVVDSYKTVMNQYRHGFPITWLEAFIKTEKHIPKYNFYRKSSLCPCFNINFSFK